MQLQLYRYGIVALRTTDLMPPHVAPFNSENTIGRSAAQLIINLRRHIPRTIRLHIVSKGGYEGQWISQPSSVTLTIATRAWTCISTRTTIERVFKPLTRCISRVQKTIERHYTIFGNNQRIVAKIVKFKGKTDRNEFRYTISIAYIISSQ